MFGISFLEVHGISFLRPELLFFSIELRAVRAFLTGTPEGATTRTF